MCLTRLGLRTYWLTLGIISLYTILQAGIGLIVHIRLYFLYTCGITSVAKYEFFRYVTYAYNPKCGTLQDLFGPMVESIDPNKPSMETFVGLAVYKLDFSNITTPAGGMFMYNKLFIASDIAWIVVSLPLLWGAVKAYISPKRVLVCYVPWLIVTYLILVLDLSAILLLCNHVLDILQFKNWARYIGVGSEEMVDRMASLVPINEPGLSILMEVFRASRFCVVMLLNVAGFIAVFTSVVLACPSTRDMCPWLVRAFDDVSLSSYGSYSLDG